AREARTLVQLSIDGVIPPMPFNQIQCADLKGWTGEADAAGWLKVTSSIAELSGGRPAVAPPTAAAARKHSICVLPFINMSGDPEQEYFSDGISEDIITDLSKVSALFVIARNTAFAFKGKSIDVAQIAGQLNVGHVLEGSVRKAGGRVRITAQLIDGASGGHVWAERYDRDLDDIFALQDEISQAIVGALKLKLLPAEKKAIENRGTESVEAYNLYLMARQYWLEGNVGDRRREDAIIRLTGRATQIDPGYARAWALMAMAQNSLRFNRGKAGDDGTAAAERALALDPTLAVPHAVRARHLLMQGQVEEAFAELETALRLDPESDEVNRLAGLMNFQANRLDQSIRYFAKAATLSETDFGSCGMLISCYSAIGDDEGVRHAAQMTLARAEKVVAQDSSNAHAIGFAVSALIPLGEIDRAKEWIDRALLIDPDNDMVRYNFACALSARGDDIDGALAILEPVFANMSIGMLGHVKVDPDMDSLRDLPRFKAMLAQAEAKLAATT
ncbi:MAG TPA: hypothetical protein VGI30_04500, partial [Caulobacteraceae bacterium]